MPLEQGPRPESGFHGRWGRRNARALERASQIGPLRSAFEALTGKWVRIVALWELPYERSLRVRFALPPHATAVDGSLAVAPLKGRAR